MRYEFRLSLFFTSSPGQKPLCDGIIEERLRAFPKLCRALGDAFVALENSIRCDAVLGPRPAIRVIVVELRHEAVQRQSESRIGALPVLELLPQLPQFLRLI